MKSSFSTQLGLASFWAASSPHSRYWLFAMTISSCGTRLDDEAVRIGVYLRLGLTICVPHQCHCRPSVDALGLHGFVCKKAPGRPTRHHALNYLVARATASTGIPVSKEPQGLSHSDGKWPDSLSLILQAGKPLTWDVTVVCLLADSYIATATQEAGSVAELAADRKSAKYTDLDTCYSVQLVAVETLVPISDSAGEFLFKLGRKISLQWGSDREIQQFNASSLHGSFAQEED